MTVEMHEATSSAHASVSLVRSKLHPRESLAGFAVVGFLWFARDSVEAGAERLAAYYEQAYRRIRG